MDKQLFHNIKNQLEGKVFSTENVVSNMEFIRQLKKEANDYDWLYHCTNSIAFLSILKNKEFWLTNLKLVNDKEEAERIDVPEYENSYYVACFTYDDNISREHWEEYGNMSDGVLIGVKNNWFIRNACFMNTENRKSDEEFFKIYSNSDVALNKKIDEQLHHRIVNPFYINSFSFYKIIYDDNLSKSIKGLGSVKLSNGISQGRTLTPEIAGLIKNTRGLSRRAGKKEYEKDWSSEKEVRLKVGIQQFNNFKNGYEMHDRMIVDKCFFPKIAVPIIDEAFDVIKIKFSPDFINKDAYIEAIKSIRPKSKIEIF